MNSDLIVMLKGFLESPERHWGSIKHLLPLALHGAGSDLKLSITGSRYQAAELEVLGQAIWALLMGLYERQANLDNLLKESSAEDVAASLGGLIDGLQRLRPLMQVEDDLRKALIQRGNILKDLKSEQLTPQSHELNRCNWETLHSLERTIDNLHKERGERSLWLKEVLLSVFPIGEYLLIKR